MKTTALKALGELEACLLDFGEGAAERKLALLRHLEKATLGRASQVLRLHEALCVLRAYPDNETVLTQVERMISRFRARKDLRRNRADLADTGVAGTEIRYRFFWPTARWLARRWGGRLRIDWEEFENAERLDKRLHLLALYGETPGLDEYGFSLREWLRRMKGAEETDAAFLIRRVEALRMFPEARETFYDELALPLILAPGPDTPSRTQAKHPDMPVHYQKGTLSRARPTLPGDIVRRPVPVRLLSPEEGRVYVDMAREAMVTRSRDLDAFAYGSPEDVRLVDFGNGLQFACIGQVPERRLLLESVYGFLTLKNGVPVGYVLSSALFRSSEVAYNVFETYRGKEAGYIYGCVLAMLRQLFGSDTFTIYPYQLGYGNDEGLKSGAWWFYQKLGFRPRDPGVARLMEMELRVLKGDPGHRSSLPTLKKLAAENLYYSLGKERGDVIGLLPLSMVGLHVIRFLAERFGSDREKGVRKCSREAAALLGVRSLRGFTAGERLAWERWSPLVLTLPGVERWSREDRKALSEVVRAKGGPRETDFVARFDRHRRLRTALRALALREV